MKTYKLPKSTTKRERNQLEKFLSWVGVLYGFLLANLIWEAVIDMVSWNLGPITRIVMWTTIMAFIGTQTVAVRRIAESYLEYRITAWSELLVIIGLNRSSIFAIVVSHCYIFFIPSLYGSLTQHSNLNVGLSPEYCIIDLLYMSTFALMMAYVKARIQAQQCIDA